MEQTLSIQTLETGMGPIAGSTPAGIYPKAVLKLLPGVDDPDLAHYGAVRTLENVNLVVLHITQGETEDGAYQTFLASRKPNRTCSHFAIDRDGKVYQYVSILNVAWHASQANAHSVGIEHVAVAGKMLATPAQYQASAELVKWLCGELKIPVDRNCVRTHNEASPADGHVLCCTGALDPNVVVGLARRL